MTQPARVVFTQFLQPNGRKAPCPIDVTGEVKKLAKVLTEAGFRFELEVLRSGQLNMDCCGLFRGDDQPIAGYLCSKVDVETGAETLIREAYKRYIAGVD
jgi:hypothetical protein